MTDRMMGLETEMGFSIPGLDVEGRCRVLERLMDTARRLLRHLPGTFGGGIFLGNGSRLYIDTGGHPEFCTPEVDDPAELVRYICAGDRILERIGERLASALRLPDLLFFKCHVDYSRLATWGCHENYANRCARGPLATQLIPHLASRIVLVGGGGIDPHRMGIEFRLSSRACHLQHATCSSSTGGRGLFHGKEEPLAGHGWSRLHILCGESALSHRAMYLKAGTTALVVAMIEGGLDPGARVRLCSPVEALRAFNADLTGRAVASLADGGEMNALQIQRHYLECAERNLGHNCMPRWAAECCRVWRETIELVERGAGAVDRMLDWAIKDSLYQSHLRRRGISPEELAFWNDVLSGLKQTWDEQRGGLVPFTVDRLLEDELLLRAYEPRRRALGLKWERLDDFLRCRAELCELEVRFSLLDKRGIFHALDQAGHLNHALPGVTRAGIEAATEEPPARGRAGVRGRLIREFSGQPGYSADWSCVVQNNVRHLDLSDPSASEPPAWRPVPRPVEFEPDPAGPLLNDANRRYDRGEYEEALRVLAMIREMRGRGLRTTDRVLQLISWVQSRRGDTAGSLRALDEIPRPGPLSLERVADYVATHRFAGLAPATGAMEPWIQQADAIMAAQSSHPAPVLFAYLGHKAAWLARQGRLDDARSALERANATAMAFNPESRVFARNLCDLAELFRLRNETQLAAVLLDQARRTQSDNGYEGDFAEFNLPRRAKLAANRAEAKSLLNQARLIQRRLGHTVGMARTVLLQARLFPARCHNQRRKRILLAWQRAVPALRDCPLMRRIMAEWDQWVGGHSAPGEDFFWGL